MSHFSCLFAWMFSSCLTLPDPCSRAARKKEVEVVIFSWTQDRSFPVDVLNVIERYVWYGYVDYRKALFKERLRLSKISNARNLTLDEEERRLFFTQGHRLYVYDIESETLDFFDPPTPSWRGGISSLVVMPSDRVFFSTCDTGFLTLKEGTMGVYPIYPKIFPNHLVSINDRIIYAEGDLLGCIKLDDDFLEQENFPLTWGTGAGEVRCLTTKDGWLFSGHAGSTVKLWNLAKQKMQGVLSHKKARHHVAIDCISAHLTQPMIAFGGQDRTIEFWDNRGQRDQMHVQLPRQIMPYTVNFRFTHDGGRLVAGVLGFYSSFVSTPNVFVWDMRVLKRHLHSTAMVHLSSFAIQSNGAIWAGADGIRCWL